MRWMRCEKEEMKPKRIKGESLDTSPVRFPTVEDAARFMGTLQDGKEPKVLRKGQKGYNKCTLELGFICHPEYTIHT